MIKITREQRFILYALGLCYEQANKRFTNSPIEIAMPKTAFIELAMKSGFARKKERALYKNLESLEKRKLVSYENKSLALTAKGERVYSDLKQRLQPYINVSGILAGSDILKFTKKARTVLSAKLLDKV